MAEEANGETYIPFENGKIVDAKEEQEEEPVSEVVNAVPDNSQLVVETNVKIEEAPKKSYASIVSHQKLGIMVCLNKYYHFLLYDCSTQQFL